jgi:hypothetical protein
MGLNLNININGAKKGLVTPPIPTLGTLVVISDTQINIPVTSSYPYEMWYSTDDVTYTKHGDGSTTPYEATGLTAGTLYYFKARGKNGSKYSDFTAATSKSTWTNNLATGWTNSGTYPYETLVSSAENITSAINSSGLASAFTNSFNIEIGEVYVVDLNLTINSGVAPRGLFMQNGELLAGTASNAFVFVAGTNQVEFTITATYTNAEFILRTTASGDAQNFLITNFKIRKKL